jgi:hypothetical protein
MIRARLEPLQCRQQHHCNDGSAWIAQLRSRSKNDHQDKGNIAYTLRVPPIMMKATAATCRLREDDTLAIVVVTLPS